MTDPNKAAVLAKCSDAIAHQDGELWNIRCYNGRIGWGGTEPEAWADAARRPNSTFQDRWQAESRRRA